MMNAWEIVHHYFNPRIGWLELTTSDAGVRSISFMRTPPAQASRETDPIMSRLIDELDRYFEGRLQSFSVPLDMPPATPFFRSVWEELVRIPYGQTRSYGQVAAAVGIPRGARAVGSANRWNCISILIPCHRVINADGTIGGFASGLDIKRALLALEGVTFYSGSKVYVGPSRIPW